MSRTRHTPHWDKTNGHGFFKRRLARRLRAQTRRALREGREMPRARRQGYG